MKKRWSKRVRAREGREGDQHWERGGGEAYDVGRRREGGGREGDRVVRVGENCRVSKDSSYRVSYTRAIGW